MTDRRRTPPYSMIIEWDPRDDVFVVTIPEFDRCHTHGHDYEGATRNGRAVIEDAVELDRRLGLPLPVPRVFESRRSDRVWEAGVLASDTVRAADNDGYPPYSMILEWDPRDDIFVATIPEFRGARTHGKTYDQAARMGREVTELFVDQAREDGELLPPIRVYRPRRVQVVV